MSLNWSVRQLASAIKQILVPVEDVVVGDILVDDFGVQQIAKVTREGGHAALYDEDGNGGTYLPKMQIWIIDRKALAAKRSVPARKRVRGAR